MPQQLLRIALEATLIVVLLLILIIQFRSLIFHAHMQSVLILLLRFFVTLLKHRAGHSVHRR